MFLLLGNGFSFASTASMGGMPRALMIGLRGKIEVVGRVMGAMCVELTDASATVDPSNKLLYLAIYLIFSSLPSVENH